MLKSLNSVFFPLVYIFGTKRWVGEMAQWLRALSARAPNDVGSSPSSHSEKLTNSGSKVSNTILASMDISLCMEHVHTGRYTHTQAHTCT